MELQYGKSISELNEMGELPPDFFKNKKPTMLILSGVKLFTEAKKIYAEGNVEKSYIFFMRYLNLISHINKMSLNPKENEYFKEKVTAKDLTKAIEYAETLNHRLQEEFQRRQEESLLKKKTSRLKNCELK